MGDRVEADGAHAVSMGHTEDVQHHHLQTSELSFSLFILLKYKNMDHHNVSFISRFYREALDD